MSPKHKIFHLVCPNGLGHFKRTIEIWSRLIHNTNVKVTIGCEEWQYQCSSSLPALQFLDNSKKVSFQFIEMQGALRWMDNPSEYSIFQYQRSLKTITSLPVLRNADLVLSDNLAGIIGSHPNVILVGSFMWHDVLENSFKKGPEAIISYEKELLEKHCTPCISVREITMPAVCNSTSNIGLNWFCDDVYDRPEVVAKEQWNVLFSTGLSGAENQRLKGLFDELMADNSFEVYGTPAFKKQFDLEDDSTILNFAFTDKAFKDIDLLVARPGIGSITEAIKFRIPIVAVDNGCNTEMIYNSARIEELGIGWNALDRNVSNHEIKALFNNALKNMKNRPVNGFDQFRKILNEHL